MRFWWGAFGGATRPEIVPKTPLCLAGCCHCPSLEVPPTRSLDQYRSRSLNDSTICSVSQLSIGTNLKAIESHTVSEGDQLLIL